MKDILIDCAGAAIGIGTVTTLSFLEKGKKSFQHRRTLNRYKYTVS